MLPYNFSKENYTDMGYVTEGVTTYMGDRILLKVEFFLEINILMNWKNYFNDIFIAMVEIITLFQNLAGIRG